VADGQNDGGLRAGGRALGFDIEAADGHNLIVEKFDAQRFVGGSENIQQAAPAGVVPHLGNHAGGPVAPLGQPQAEIINVHPPAAFQAQGRTGKNSLGHHPLPQRVDRRDHQMGSAAIDTVKTSEKITDQGGFGGIVIEGQDFLLGKVNHRLGAQPGFQIVRQLIG